MLNGSMTIAGQSAGRSLGDATTSVVAKVFASNAPFTPAATDSANWIWVCDGTADDVQIQAAIDLVTVTGGIVWLSAGDFYISASLQMKGNVILQGSSVKKTLLRTSSLADSFIKINDAFTSATATLAEDLDNSETGVDVSAYAEFSYNQTIKIEDEEMKITVSPSSNTLTVTRGVHGTTPVTHDNGLPISVHTEVYGVEFRDFFISGTNQTSGHGIDITGARAPMFSNVRIESVFDAGIYANGAAHISDNPRLFDVTVKSCGGSGIHWTTVYAFQIIGGYALSNTASGIRMVSSGEGSITGFISDQNTANGVWLYACNRVTISGNPYFGANGAHGLRIEQGSKNITVNGNVIVDNDTAAAGNSGIRLTGAANFNIVIDGNIITNVGGTTQDYGVRLDAGSYNITVANNDLGNNATAAVLNSTTANIGSIFIANNQGYVARGEIRMASGTLTAGAANAISFAWNNPFAQDILIRKVVIEVTTPGGTALSVLNVGIADDATGTNLGTEFFPVAGLNLNAAAVNDSWNATDTGAQTKWVVCQDSASATDDWVVGKILTADAASLVGTYHIEYAGR